MTNPTPNARIVLRCSECGDRSAYTTWRNGMILCEICDGNIDREPMRGKPMARSWDDYQGRGKSKRGH